MLKSFKKLYAYPFEGYWRDIGTIDSIWEANMDLLNPDNELNLYDEDWKICTKTESRPAQHIGKSAKVSGSLISEGCVILGTVENSVIFPGVYVAEDAYVKDSVVMTNARILSHSEVIKAIIGTGAVINGDNTIGDGNEVTLIADKRNVKPGTYSVDADIVG